MARQPMPFVVILAGGRGTRLAEETGVRPKPMVEIGGRPVLWHIMKLYGHHGFNDFAICLGYKGEVIKDYFVNYMWKTQDVHVDLKAGTCQATPGAIEPWRVWLLDTGEATNTGGRLRRLHHLGLPKGNDSLMMTYGDGLADVDIHLLWDYHQSHGKLATVTCAAPPGRFGSIQVDSHGQVTDFEEKPVGGDGRVNAGYFVLNRRVLEMIRGDNSSFEHEVLPALAREGQLMAHHHSGFWKPMDTARDRDDLQALWDTNAPWRVWST